MGAIGFSDALAEIEGFVQTHPDDVVIVDIQDATTPADTAAAIEAAGLGDRAYTLDPDRPLPTLGDIVRSGKNLLVFAEGGGPGAPPWYHRAYEHWFQETPYAHPSIDDMSCGPNRGPSDAPLFLVNHWISVVAARPGQGPGGESPARPGGADPPLPRREGPAAERGGGGLRQPGRPVQDGAAGQRRAPGGGAASPARRRGRAPAPAPAPATNATPTVDPGPVAPQPLIAPPTAVTTLTGGDPDPFCAMGPAARNVVGAWALAELVAPASGLGLPDLAYGPAAARALDALQPVAPDELVRLFTPAQERARAAVKALGELGVPAAVVAEVADLADAQAVGARQPRSRWSPGCRARRLRAVVDEGPLAIAAQAFAAANPEPPGLFDLGQVQHEAALAAGYDCLEVPAAKRRPRHVAV